MKYVFKTTPWPHQVKAFKFVWRHLRDYGSAGLQVPMRYGKSKIAIDAASALHLKEGLERVLVVTTTSGLGVWEAEVPKHCPFPVIVKNYNGWTIQKDKGARLKWLIVHHAVLYDREFGWDEDNPQSWQPMPNSMIEDFDPEMVIIDESHKIGDPGSEQCKMAYRYGKGAKYRMTLTGTKFHRGPRMVFGQFKFLDDGIFGTVTGAFNRQFIKYGGYGNYEIVGYRNLDVMAEKIKSRVFIAKKLPPKQKPIITVTPVEMDDCKEAYKEMVSDAAIVVKGHAIMAPIVLTKHLRCMMIAGGWVKTEEGLYLRVGGEKRRTLEDRLTLMFEEGIEKVVIGARFIPELKDIADAAKVAGYRRIAIHGGVARGEARTLRVERFRTAEVPTVMVCQIAAASEAIDLSTAQHMIYYSIPESYVQYDQFFSRIERYNEKRTLSYEHLIMKRSRDEVTYEAMNLKMDVAKYLVTDPARVQRISEREDAFFRPV